MTNRLIINKISLFDSDDVSDSELSWKLVMRHWRHRSRFRFTTEIVRTSSQHQTLVLVHMRHQTTSPHPLTDHLQSVDNDIVWSQQPKDYIYRMVKVQVQQYLTKQNNCIWPIRTHYTSVSTNEQFAPNEDDLAMVQRPSTITILYTWSLVTLQYLLYTG